MFFTYLNLDAEGMAWTCEERTEIQDSFRCTEQSLGGA